MQHKHKRTKRLTIWADPLTESRLDYIKYALDKLSGDRTYRVWIIKRAVELYLEELNRIAAKTMQSRSTRALKEEIRALKRHKGDYTYARDEAGRFTSKENVKDGQLMAPPSPILIQ